MAATDAPRNLREGLPINGSHPLTRRRTVDLMRVPAGICRT